MEVPVAIVTLIAPPGLKSFSGLQMHAPNPPLGLAYIAAAVREEGIQYTVVDAAGEALDQVSPYPDRKDLMVQGLSTAQILERIPPATDVVGLSCNFSTLWPIVRQIAEAVRGQFPKALIVLGGEHGTAVPENVLKTSDFDVVVLGEGEETFVSVVRSWRQGSGFDAVEGIAYRVDGEIHCGSISNRIRNVNDIAPPDWASFPLEEYIERHQINGVNIGRSMPILATRGCPYQCTFCSNPAMWTTRYIARDPKLVVDEMEFYAREYGVSNFDFQDLTAIVKRRWVLEFCDEIKARNLKITWQMPSGTRSEIFDDDIAEALVQSGCYALSFAPESGAPEILDSVKKQVDLDNLQKAITITLNKGMKLSCFFVIGFPDETKASLKQTLSFIRRISIMGVHDVGVARFVPYPGSAIFKQLLQDDAVSLDDDFFMSPMDYYSSRAPSFSKEVSGRYTYWTMIWMYVNFYVLSFTIHPLRTMMILVRSIVTGREETRYSKWFVDQLRTRRRWRGIASENQTP
jgi:anaerobic magnesium-protoporphyrin IX monomethyl ester cyclase